LVPAQLDAFYERHVKPNNTSRTAAEVMRALNKDVRSAWGERRVQDITRRDVIELLDSIVDRGKPIAANRALAYTRRFFNWLIERSVIETSPCDRVKAPASERDRDRILTDDEIRWLWKATERAAYPFGPFVRLLLLTGQRRDEVAKARYREFLHQALWQIPKERTKNGIAHEVPLSTAAQEMIAALPALPDALVSCSPGPERRQSPVTQTRRSGSTGSCLTSRARKLPSAASIQARSKSRSGASTICAAPWLRAWPASAMRRM
jgi:integrase